MTGVAPPVPVPLTPKPGTDSVMSAIPVPLVKEPDRMVGAEAYTSPKDIPTGATATVPPDGITVSDELIFPSPVASNCGDVKEPPVAKLSTMR
jgi:hypothetical protein